MALEAHPADHSDETTAPGAREGAVGEAPRRRRSATVYRPMPETEPEAWVQEAVLADVW